MANHVLSWCRGAGMIAVLGLLPLPAAAADRTWATYAEVHSIFARFEAVPHDKRSLLQLRVRATPGEAGQDGEPVRLKIATRAGVRPVSITADGFLKLPPDAELVRDNPMITTSLPAGTPLLLRPELIFVPLPLPGVSIAGLSARLDQANRTVRSQLGFWAMFAPRARNIGLVFADPATEVVLKAPGGTTRLVPDPQGRVVIKPDRRLAGSELRYAVSPVLARPIFAGSMVLRAGAD